jgi:hypothetical protein
MDVWFSCTRTPALPDTPSAWRQDLEQVQCTPQNIKTLWSSCILTPLHSLTGPVDQLFVSCLGGQWFVPGVAPTLLELGSSVSISRYIVFASCLGGQWLGPGGASTILELLAMFLYIGDPDVIPDH